MHLVWVCQRMEAEYTAKPSLLCCAGAVPRWQQSATTIPLEMSLLVPVTVRIPCSTGDAAEHLSLQYLRQGHVLNITKSSPDWAPSLLDKKSLIISICWIHEDPGRSSGLTRSRQYDRPGYTMAGQFLLWKGRGAKHPLGPLRTNQLGHVREYKDN